MKKTMMLFLVLMATLGTFAQYQPNTKWPYIYDDFTEGTIYSSDNKKSTYKFNVHLSGNVLHYIGNDGRIYKADDRNVVRVEIGQDAYLFVNHQLMQLIANKGDNVLLKLVRADFERMVSDGGGAYGSSLSSSATNKLSSLDLGGLNVPEHGKMLQEKRDGAEIPVNNVYFIIYNGKQFEATKGNIANAAGEARSAELKAFVKKNKIKWKDERSLGLILNFLTGQAE